MLHLLERLDVPINTTFKFAKFDASLLSTLTNNFNEIRTAFNRVVGGRDYRSGVLSVAFVAAAQANGTITFPGSAFASFPFVLVCPANKFPVVDCECMVRSVTTTTFNYRINTDAPYTGNIELSWVAFL